MPGYNIWKNPSEGKHQPLGRDQDSEAHVSMVQARVCAGPCTSWTRCKCVTWTGARQVCMFPRVRPQEDLAMEGTRVVSSVRGTIGCGTIGSGGSEGESAGQ